MYTYIFCFYDIYLYINRYICIYIYTYIRVKHSNLPKLFSEVYNRIPRQSSRQAPAPALGRIRVDYGWFISSEHPIFCREKTLPETNSSAPENDGFQ